MQVDLKTVLVLGAVAVAGVAVWRVSRAASSAAGQVIDAAGRAWDAAGTAAASPVYAVGDFLGIPRTDQTECQRAIAEGRTWDASFACPASDFLGYLVSPSPAKAPADSVGSGYSWPVQQGGQRNNNPSAYTAPDTITPDYSGAGVWG